VDSRRSIGLMRSQLPSASRATYVALPLEGQRRGLAVHGRNMIAPAFARSADALGTLTVSAGRP
jgi:hypothetical protein